MHEELAALREGLRSASLDVKAKSAFDLGKMGVEAKEALGDILDVYFNEALDFNTWSNIAKAVQRIVFYASQKHNHSPAKYVHKRIESELSSIDPARREKAALLTRYIPS